MSDIINIINSIFSENKLTIEDKGYDFEDYVFDFLEEQMEMIDRLLDELTVSKD